MKIVMSSGHGKYIRGASGYIDEVDEARRVVERTADILRASGVEVTTFHDNTSHDQSTNLNTIVNFHNAQPSHDLDVSIHFNAYKTQDPPVGTECLYKTQEELADEVSEAIADVGFINRGPKYRSDLKFLNATREKAVLVEVCFVDSRADADLYLDQFEETCTALAAALAGEEIEPGLPKPPPRPIDDDHPVLGKGDKGPTVGRVQQILGIPADGDFGPITESAVKGYQAAVDLTPDGIVGPNTWEYLEELERRKKAGGEVLTAAQISEITTAANTSAIADYLWKDRGQAPSGYIAGVCCAFAHAVIELDNGHPMAMQMAQADRNDSDEDALTWYRSQYQKLGMNNSKDGVDTLRHLFALIMGLGMRESSGRYSEGVDQSASNHEPDTAECGAWQTSYNIKSCSANIADLLDAYWENPNGFLDVFRKGVSLKSKELENYGVGADGTRFQFVAKYAPAMHCFATAIGMRYLRQHWGPINRNEAELKREADDLLLRVQAMVDDWRAIA